MTNFIPVLFIGGLDPPTGFPKKDLHGWVEVEYIFSIQEERLTCQQLRRENDSCSLTQRSTSTQFSGLCGRLHDLSGAGNRVQYAVYLGRKSVYWRAARVGKECGKMCVAVRTVSKINADFSFSCR